MGITKGDLWPFALLEKFCSHEFVTTVAILNYLCHFGLFPVLGSLIFLYLLFSPYWYLSALYFIWYVYDAKTPQEGGRLIPYLRSWRSWRKLAEYFPVKLEKDCDLSPENNYVFGYHPHGITVYGAFTSFGTCSTGFTELFPGLESHLMTIEIYYKFPIFRDYLMMAGCCNVAKASYMHLLTKMGKGQVAVVVPGGAEEALDCQPGKMGLILKQRRGFIKMALRTGAHLVPVIGFGENETYRQVSNPRGSTLRRWQLNLMHQINFSPPLFYGKMGSIPYRTPINVVVGKPIPVERVEEPSWERVCEVHEIYSKQLTELFDKYREKYGYDKTYKLEIH